MTVRQYRYLLVASFLLGLIGGLFDTLVPSALPASLSLAVESQLAAFSERLLILFSVVVLAGIVLQAISVIGLYRFRPWAPRLALVITVVGILMNVSFGAKASSAWAYLFQETSQILWGLILGVIYFSPLKSRFARDGQHMQSNEASVALSTAKEDSFRMEVEQRYRKLIATGNDQVKWRLQWVDILEAKNLSGQPQEQKRKAALGAACRLLNIEATEANLQLGTVSELADVLEGDYHSTEMAKNRRSDRMIGFSIVFFCAAVLGAVFLALGNIWLGVLCFLFAALNAGIVVSMSTGKPVWVNKLFMEYYW